jgi:hypothetical protein
MRRSWPTSVPSCERRSVTRSAPQGDAFLLALAGRVTRSEQRRGGQHAFEAITGRPSLGGIGGFRSHRLYDEVLDRLRQGLMDADRIDQLPV